MKRRGFTLVELLIVIVVIGVLSAMMMLSSTEAVSSAKASNIVSNLRNLKTAALAWYADHLDTADASDFNFGDDGEASLADIKKYLNNEADTALEDYNIQGSVAGTWFVKYTKVDTTVGGKLAGRAKSVGLLQTADSDDWYPSSNGGTTVYMYVR